MNSISSSGFSFSGWLAGVRTQVPNLFAGRHYIFNSEQISISVREEHALAHSAGTAARARESETGVEFDLRRLRIGAEAGGLVTLAMLEALERESQLAVQAGSHPHIARCHASLVENLGTEHCRLLLCDPCCGDFSAHLKAHGGSLPVESVAEIGQQLALGLRHLHSLDILCGSVTSHGVLLGCDGKWKLLGELTAAASLPCSMEEWQPRRLAVSSPDARPLLLPPEARAAAGGGNREQSREAAVPATPALDIWMLGALLAVALEGVDDRGIGGTRAGNAVLAATEDVLLCPYAARLWMLLHWMLATEPVQRPWSRRLVEVTHSLSEWWPQDLLIEMPEYARFHCQGMATAAARRLAFAGVGGATSKRSCAAGLPLEVLRQSLADPSAVDQLCDNCGLELGEYPSAPEDDSLHVPSLLPVLCAPFPSSIEAMASDIEEELCPPKSYSPSSYGFQTDESTDEGSASGDESTVSSDRSTTTRRRLHSWSGSAFDDAGDGSCEKDRHLPRSVMPRQRRPTTARLESRGDC